GTQRARSGNRLRPPTRAGLALRAEVACRHRCPEPPALIPSHRSRAHRRCDMAKVSKETASEVMAVDGYDGRSQDLGGYTVASETFSSDEAPAPLFQGLPDVHCQCPDWGTGVMGEPASRYSDGTSE